MFKDTTSPVPLEEKDYVISPSPPEVSPQIDSRNLPTSFKPFGNQGFGNPVASQCSLQMVWVQLRPQCCSGSGEKHLLRTGAGAWACSAKKAVSTSSWNHAPSPGTVLVFFFSASHITVSHVTIWRKKVKGNFMQSNNQRILELCSVIIQRICFAASALAYTGSRDVSYQFPFGFCAYW